MYVGGCVCLRVFYIYVGVCMFEDVYICVCVKLQGARYVALHTTNPPNSVYMFILLAQHNKSMH